MGCEVCSMECVVSSMKCGVWSVMCGEFSVESGVRSNTGKCLVKDLQYKVVL